MLTKIIEAILAIIRTKITAVKSREKKLLRKYTTKYFVFNPDEYHQIKFDDKTVRLPPLQAKLLVYFVENPYKTLNRDDILDNVWGSQESSYEVITRTLSELRDKIPEDCAITTVRGVGYAFEHDVSVEQVKFERLERLFAHSPGVRVFLYAVLYVFGFSIIASSGFAISHLHYAANSPPHYKLENIDPQFTRDHTINMPQLLPGGRFIAYKLSNSLLENSHLALLDLQTRETRQLVPASFDKGYKANLSGDKIVYQNTLTGKCEIRLLTFHNDDKTTFNNEHLSFCAPKSGHISFAWFNDSEFYANFVTDKAAPTTNNLPFHHIYSFNINTKDKLLVEKATDTGGIGFYSLQYDITTKQLYFLQTHNFKTTSIYQYNGKTIRKKHIFNQYLPFYTVTNNRLIYKHNNKNFVINDLAKGFNRPQELLRPRLTSLNQPNSQGDKLVYLEGDVYKTAIYQLTGGQLTALGTNGFDPQVLANYNNQLVFSAKATNTTQVYLLKPNNKVMQISKMKVNEQIRHIEIAGDIFVLSYANKVVIYQLKNQQLVLVKTIPKFNRGAIDKAGKHLLLSPNKGNTVTDIIEKRLDDLTPTGKSLSRAKFAFYHQNEVIYLDNDNELFRLTSNGPMAIASNISARRFEYISINGDELYYFDWNSLTRPVYKVNLVTGIKEKLNLNGLIPTQIQSANNRLFIGAKGSTKATLVVGDIVLYK